MAMQRWDPFRELRQMEDTMNKLWRGYSGSPATSTGAEDWNVLLDVIEKKEEIEVKASMPGVTPEDIDVTVEDNVLTIKAERKAESAAEGEAYLLHERPIGSFYRALRLPDTIAADKIQSHYTCGVLTISMPKAEEKKKKKIQVKVVENSKQIDSKK